MKALLATLLLLPTLLFSQARYDANWVFGNNCGLRFEQDTISTFTPVCLNYEPTASISDSNGNFLFYLSSVIEQSLIGPYVFRDTNNTVLDIDSLLFVHNSTTHGLLI